MICPECGSELTNKETTCKECGCVIKNTKVVELKDSKKSINKKFSIIIGSIILVIILFIIIGIVSKNIELSRRSKIISKYCNNGEYIENTSLEDFIDEYKCDAFASYMYDTKGSILKESHYNKLINFKDASIYPIIKEFTGVEIINLYDEMITEHQYYKYLDEIDNFSIIDKEEYSNLLEYALEKKDLKLWESLIDGSKNSSKKLYWDDVKYYFGPSYTLGKYESFDYNDVKKYIDEQKEFVDKYLQHNNPTIICLLDKDLLKYCYDKKGNIDSNIRAAFTSVMTEIPLNELKKYKENGGYFYKKDDYLLDSILSDYIFELGDKTFESDDIDKINFIFQTAKKEGMDITYSNYLDRYMYYHSISVMYKKNSVYSKIYRAFKNNGFKCYQKCSYEKYYK